VQQFSIVTDQPIGEPANKRARADGTVASSHNHHKSSLMTQQVPPLRPNKHHPLPLLPCPLRLPRLPRLLPILFLLLCRPLLPRHRSSSRLPTLRPPRHTPATPLSRSLRSLRCSPQPQPSRPLPPLPRLPPHPPTCQVQSTSPHLYLWCSLELTPHLRAGLETPAPDSAAGPTAPVAPTGPTATTPAPVVAVPTPTPTRKRSRRGRKRRRRRRKRGGRRTRTVGRRAALAMSGRAESRKRQVPRGQQ
jgi:hypothetical protein